MARKPIARVQVTRAMMEQDDCTRSDITKHMDGTRAIEYVETARIYGLTDREIEEDIAGDEAVECQAYDGFVRWACGAMIEGDAIILFAPSEEDDA